MSDQKQEKSQTKSASIVIMAAMIGWLAVNFLGDTLGLSGRYAYLADFAAMAAFAYAMIVLFRVWRQRQEGE